MTLLLLGSAFDGAVSGFLAVLLMTAFEVPFWFRFGIRGVVQWQVNEIMTFKLLSKPYAETKRLRWAILMHLFHGVVLGVLFAVLVSVTSSVGLSFLFLLGLTYSVALWLVVPFSFRRRLERAGKTRFTNGGVAVSLIAHLVYGLFVGGFLFILLQ